LSKRFNKILNNFFWKFGACSWYCWKALIKWEIFIFECFLPIIYICLLIFHNWGFSSRSCSHWTNGRGNTSRSWSIMLRLSSTYIKGMFNV
jgi:hypothetical protein